MLARGAGEVAGDEAVEVEGVEVTERECTCTSSADLHDFPVRRSTYKREREREKRREREKIYVGELK